MNIEVIIPHYKAERWLIPCLDTLRSLAKYDITKYSVWNMGSGITWPDCFEPHKDLWIHAYPTPGKVGGQPLNQVLTSAMKDVTADITVTVDPDAIVLADGWDQRLLALFADPAMMVAGINPRSNYADFAGVPEWNWMAFRTSFWHQHVQSFTPQAVDIGHRFSIACKLQGKKYHTWPHQKDFYPGKIASAVGDTPDDLWAFHAFYSTRRRDDVFPDSERAGILTEQEERDCIQWCRDYRRPTIIKAGDVVYLGGQKAIAIEDAPGEYTKG